MLVALPARELNYEEFKSGGLHEKRAVATGNHLSICLKTLRLGRKFHNICSVLCWVRDGKQKLYSYRRLLLQIMLA
jgi:hypothetical protein